MINTYEIKHSLVSFVFVVYLYDICILALYLIIGTIWRRTEQVMFFGTIPISNALGGAFAGLISLGFLKLDGVLGLSSWKWYILYLITFTPQHSSSLME